MGILSTIFSKIFPSSHPANSGNDATAAAATAPATSDAAPAPTAAATAAAATPAAAVEPVDVEAVLTSMEQEQGAQLNWRTSIVDLMKLLNMDSSLQARKQLAQELHYSGDTDDSASMNIWLHREVMNKVAANGGKVPANMTA